MLFYSNLKLQHFICKQLFCDNSKSRVPTASLLSELPIHLVCSETETGVRPRTSLCPNKLQSLNKSNSHRTETPHVVVAVVVLGLVVLGEFETKAVDAREDFCQLQQIKTPQRTSTVVTSLSAAFLFSYSMQVYYLVSE